MARKKRQVSRFIYWSPRILAVLFILFLVMFSLDVFESCDNLSLCLIGLLMHNIPSIILTIILVASWRYEIVGGIAFLFGALLYFLLVLNHGILTALLWSSSISLPAVIIGILFLINWRKRQKRNS